MNAARDEILARVRGALADATPTEPVPRAYRRAGVRDEPARVALLIERLCDYHVQVERTSAATLRDAVAAAAGGGRLVVPPGLPGDWRPPKAIEDRRLAPLELDAVDGAVTGCTLAIAETGTIVLAGGEYEGRRALTLVPDLHVCIVRAEQVVETVPEAFAVLAGHARDPLTLISGPSATSDIELSRVEGVHGPRRLIVLVLEEVR